MGQKEGDSFEHVALKRTGVWTEAGLGSWRCAELGSDGALAPLGRPQGSWKGQDGHHLPLLLERRKSFLTQYLAFHKSDKVTVLSLALLVLFLHFV